MTSFSCCFPGIYKEALEVSSCHTVMCSHVGIGNSSFRLHCVLNVWNISGPLAYLTYLVGKR